MQEPTVIEDELNTKTGESENLNPSEESKVWTDEYPKWQKSISKEYWGNEKLAKFDSLNSVIQSILNPKPIDPQSYDNVNISDSELKSKVVEAYKKSNILSKDAEEITKLFEDSKPKIYSEDELKDVIGIADYEVEKAYRDNALAKICSNNENLKADVLKSTFINEPSLFKLLSIVGKNLGDGTFEDFRTDRSSVERKDVWAEMVNRPKTYKEYK